MDNSGSIEKLHNTKPSKTGTDTTGDPIDSPLGPAGRANTRFFRLPDSARRITTELKNTVQHLTGRDLGRKVELLKSTGKPEDQTLYNWLHPSLELAQQYYKSLRDGYYIITKPRRKQFKQDFEHAYTEYRNAAISAIRSHGKKTKKDTTLQALLKLGSFHKILRQEQAIIAKSFLKNAVEAAQKRDSRRRGFLDTYETGRDHINELEEVSNFVESLKAFRNNISQAEEDLNDIDATAGCLALMCQKLTKSEREVSEKLQVLSNLIRTQFDQIFNPLQEICSTIKKLQEEVESYPDDIFSWTPDLFSKWDQDGLQWMSMGKSIDKSIREIFEDEENIKNVSKYISVVLSMIEDIKSYDKSLFDKDLNSKLENAGYLTEENLEKLKRKIMIVNFTKTCIKTGFDLPSTIKKKNTKREDNGMNNEVINDILRTCYRYSRHKFIKDDSEFINAYNVLSKLITSRSINGNIYDYVYIQVWPDIPGNTKSYLEEKPQPPYRVCINVKEQTMIILSAFRKDELKWRVKNFSARDISNLPDDLKFKSLPQAIWQEAINASDVLAFLYELESNVYKQKLRKEASTAHIDLPEINEDSLYLRELIGFQMTNEETLPLLHFYSNKGKPITFDAHSLRGYAAAGTPLGKMAHFLVHQNRDKVGNGQFTRGEAFVDAESPTLNYAKWYLESPLPPPQFVETEQILT